MQTFYFLYKTTNLINNKIYIGKHKTKNLDDGYIGSGKYLKSAIKKYGRENFKFEILTFFESEEHLNQVERQIITEEFCLRKDNYNLCVGGKGGFSYINREGLNKRRFTSETAKYARSFRKFISTKQIFAMQEGRKNILVRMAGNLLKAKLIPKKLNKRCLILKRLHLKVKTILNLEQCGSLTVP